MRNLILVSLLLLAGCATTAGYEKLLSSWVGDNVDHLKSVWGQPDNTTTLSDGGSLLEYNRQRNVQLGGYTTTVPVTTTTSGTANIYGNRSSATADYSGTSTTYVPQTTPVQNINMQCVTRFTANSQGTITRWAWQGNDCRAKEPDQKVVDQNNQNIDANKALAKSLNDRNKAICENPAYSPLFMKSPCLSKEISLAHLADNTKISKDEKAILVKYRLDIDAVTTERINFFRGDGNPIDRQVADLMSSSQPEITKYNLDLYNEAITWGEYNQRRKALYEKATNEQARITQRK